MGWIGIPFGMIGNTPIAKLITLHTVSYWQILGAIKMLRLSEDTSSTAELHPQGQTRVRAAADLVGVNYQTLRRWWQTDKFPKPIDINGILLFKNSDLLAWLASHQVNNDSEHLESTQGA